MAVAFCQLDRLMEMNRESIPTASADTMPLDAMQLVEIEDGQPGDNLEVLVGNAVLGVTHDLDSEVLDGERVTLLGQYMGG